MSSATVAIDVEAGLVKEPAAGKKKCMEENAEEKQEVKQTMIESFYSTDGWYRLGPRMRAHLTQAMFFIICLAAILPWYYATLNQDNSETFLYPQLFNVTFGPDLSQFRVKMNIQSIDPLLLTSSVAITVLPEGNFSLLTYTGELADDGTIYFSEEYIRGLLMFNNLGQANLSIPIVPKLVFFFTKGGSAEYFNFELGISSVQNYPLSAIKNVGSYPFDQYRSSIYLSMYLRVTGVNSTTGDILFAIPYAMDVANLVSGWQSSPIASRARTNRPGFFNPNTNIVEMQLNFQRYWEVKSLSIFVVIVMWIISLAVFTMAFDHYFIHPVLKEMNPSSVTIANGLLFALPALRLVQPGIPPLTTYLLVDVTGFYLNMGLVAISSILMVSKINWCVYQPKAAIEKVEGKKADAKV